MVLLEVGLIATLRVDAQAGAGTTDPVVAQAYELAPVGAELFANKCAVCHGATGLGLEEARLSFPPDHRDCTHCHRKGNPPTMSLKQIELRQHDLFDIGEAPALRGERTMAAEADPEALRAYISAAMPRYRPGSMTDEAYAAVTEFLLTLNGR